MAMKTMEGHSKEDWHKHIDNLFDIAHENEDIPFNALYAWTIKCTKEETLETVRLLWLSE